MMMFTAIASLRLSTGKVSRSTANVSWRLMATQASDEKAQRRVLIPVAQDTEEIEAVTIADTLVRAGAKVIFASVSETLDIKCSRGVRIVADCFLKDCVNEQYDAIVCPGGMPGAQHLSDSADLIKMLRAQLDQNKVVGAICAAPAVILAHHNLIPGRQATCYPAGKFMAKIDKYVSQPVVQHGNLITSQGPGTALPFSLKIVESLFGTPLAIRLGKEMIF